MSIIEHIDLISIGRSPENDDNKCDDECSDLGFSQTHLSFETVYDGFTER